MMFTNQPLRVEFVARGRVRLLQPLTWHEEDGETITVPVGFESDGASIPPIAWPIVGHPYAGSLLRAAVLHDYDLRVKEAASSFVVHQRFYHALRASGVGRFRAGLFFVAVWVWLPRW